MSHPKYDKVPYKYWGHGYSFPCPVATKYKRRRIKEYELRQQEDGERWEIINSTSDPDEKRRLMEQAGLIRRYLEAEPIDVYHFERQYEAGERKFRQQVWGLPKVKKCIWHWDEVGDTAAPGIIARRATLAAAKSD